MAPLATDPRHLQVILNSARRNALLTLITEIAGYMRQQLQLPNPQHNQAPSGSRSSGNAPLFHSSSTHSSPEASPERQRQVPPTPEVVRVRQAAIAHFDTWRRDLITRLKGILQVVDDDKILNERRERLDRIAREAVHSPRGGEDLIDIGTGTDDDSEEKARKEAVGKLQATYHPIPTRLTTITLLDRKEIVSAILLVLLSSGNYTAESRTLAVYLTSALELPLSFLVNEETEIAISLVEASQSDSAKKMSADAEAQKRKEEGKASRYWKVGLASVAGAAVIGVTGGLAAPVVAGAIGGLMGTVGLGSVASFLGIFWMNGALVGTLFGAFGARMTGEIVDQYAREVSDFRFIPLLDEFGPSLSNPSAKDRRLKVTIGINGWLTSKQDVTKPWRSLGRSSEVFALRYEMDRLLELGQSLQGLVSSYMWSTVKMELLKRTVLATLWSALWPAYLLSIASSIDNPFSLAKNRSEKAGKILADALINKVQGERPVTLVGYSLGARVIYSCLRTLAERRAFGLVENVVFIGAPVPSSRDHWLVMRSVVSGKMFNVYSENDYILAFLYRATSVQLGIAGLQEIKDIEGVENLNLTEEVQGHLRYADLIGNILVRCGFTDIQGTDGTIKKEEEEAIGLKDDDLGKMGTLIDLDDLKVAQQPGTNLQPARLPLKKAETVALMAPLSSRSPEEMKTRATVSRSMSERVVAHDPLASSTEQLSDTVLALKLAQKTPEMSKFGDEVEESSNTKFIGSLRDLSLNASSILPKQSPPAYTPSTSTDTRSISENVGFAARYQVQHEEDHGSEDEDSYEGITMKDNDDFAYVEPIPLED